MRKLHIRWAGGEVCSLQFRDLPAAVKSSRSDSTRGRADQEKLFLFLDYLRMIHNDRSR